MTLLDLKQTILDYVPLLPQEEADRCIMLRFLEEHEDAACRSNLLGHFTASAWIVNPVRDRVLMIYHNIYQAWTWPGGHADGETDLLQTAIREAEEEAGVRLSPAADQKPFSLEILPVLAHIRHGEYVAPHLHMNLTYLFQLEESVPLRSNPSENKGVRWRSVGDILADRTEPHMHVIYKKLIERM